MAAKKVIGINALFLVPNGVGGTEYHLRSFVKYLQKLDTKHDYILFCNRENYDTFTLSSPRWRKMLCPVNAQNRIQRILYEQLLFPFLVRKSGSTVLHSFGYFGPIFTLGILHLVTVHDVNWKDHPEDTPWLQNVVLGFLIENCMRGAKQIFTDSEFGKTRLLTHFPEYSDKVLVVPPGVDDDFLELLKKKTTNPLGDKKYLLCVSAFYPHKRVAELVEWWDSVQQDAALADTWLVIIGKNGADEKRVLTLVKNTKRTKHFEKISFPDLVRYYQHAQAVIHPSVYEGFGYPVYEAISSGLNPIVNSKKMYQINLQSYLTELSFNPEKDNYTINELISLKARRTIYRQLPGYRESTLKLIELYQSL